MQWIQDLASRHPELVPLVLVPIVTAITTFFFSPRTAEGWEQFQAKFGPRITGFVKLTSSVGFDTPNVQKAVITIITGRPYEPASSYLASRTIPPPAIVTTGLAEAVPKTTSDIPVTIEEPKDGAE